MNSRILRTTAIAVALFFAMLALPAWGQQTVSGNGQEQFGGKSGATLNGSNYGGWSGGAYAASDPTIASGHGGANGFGSGSQTAGPHSAMSTANSSVNSNAGAQGSTYSSVSVAGQASQSNWANTGPSNLNFAGGFNETEGGYNGNGPNNASGNGNASGKTTVSSTQTPNSANSSVLTEGTSSGRMNGASGNSSVAGDGVVGAASMVGNPTGNGSFAGGTINGKAAYQGAGPQNAVGTLTISGTTSGKIGPNSASAAAYVTSTAAAAGNGVVTPPPASGCGCGH